MTQTRRWAHFHRNLAAQDGRLLQRQNRRVQFLDFLGQLRPLVEQGRPPFVHVCQRDHDVPVELPGLLLHFFPNFLALDMHL